MYFLFYIMPNKITCIIKDVKMMNVFEYTIHKSCMKKFNCIPCIHNETDLHVVIYKAIFETNKVICDKDILISKYISRCYSCKVQKIAHFFT